MEHLHPTDEHVAYWEPTSMVPPQVLLIGGPDEGPDVTTCPTVVSIEEIDDDGVWRRFSVPLRLDEIELAHLAQGGTLWMTTFGHLPIHRLEVQPPVGRD